MTGVAVFFVTTMLVAPTAFMLGMLVERDRRVRSAERLDISEALRRRS